MNRQLKFRIWDKQNKKWQSFLSLKIENYDGFREYNSDDLLTEQEFKKCLNHENH